MSLYRQKDNIKCDILHGCGKIITLELVENAQNKDNTIFGIRSGVRKKTKSDFIANKVDEYKQQTKKSWQMLKSLETSSQCKTKPESICHSIDNNICHSIDNNICHSIDNNMYLF